MTYYLNNRLFTLFSSLEDELRFEPEKNYLFDLSYLGILHVEGQSSRDFLQGQLSCDLRQINMEQMHPGALCNLQGRILALMDVIDWHGLHLVLPADLLAETEATLSKAALFSRVKLSQPHTYQLFGFYLQNSRDLTPFNMTLPEKHFAMVSTETYCCYHLGNNFYILVVNKAQSFEIEPFQQHAQWRGSLSWHALQLRQKRLEIYPESRGLFLPHRLDLHLSDYLSFDKGCYRGQEIIARTHYRAKLKHEMKLFIIHTTKLLKSGQKLLAEDNTTEVGELIDFCPIEGNNFLIAASILLEHPQNVFLEGHHSIIALTSAA